MRGRFNIRPDGNVVGAPGPAGQQDPQIALDEMFKADDEFDDFLDPFDLMGLGPRRTRDEITQGGGAVEIRIAGGPPLLL
jgi:hypothetical protein